MVAEWSSVEKLEDTQLACKIFRSTDREEGRVARTDEENGARGWVDGGKAEG